MLATHSKLHTNLCNSKRDMNCKYRYTISLPILKVIVFIHHKVIVLIFKQVDHCKQLLKYKFYMQYFTKSTETPLQLVLLELLLYRKGI